MKQFGKDLCNVGSDRRQENYTCTIASISEDGKTANITNMNSSLLRNARIILPYGISCTGNSGMNTHVVLDGNNSCIMGVFDQSRPLAKPGELILYSSGGAMIRLLTDGSISVNGNVSINGDVAITGDISVNGNVTITGGFTVNGRSPIYDI